MNSKGKPFDPFVVQKRLLQYMGVSLFGNEGALYIFYSFTAAALKATWVALAIVEIFLNLGDLNTVIKSAIFVSGMSMDTMKMCILYISRQKLRAALKEFETRIYAHMSMRKQLVEEDLVKETIRNGKLQSIVGSVTGTLAVLLLFFTCYIQRLSTSDSKKWDLPLGRSSVIDATLSPNYEFVLISQTLAINLAALGYTSSNLLLYSVLAHIALQCRILKSRITQFMAISSRRMLQDRNEMQESSTSEINPSHIPWKYLKETLAEIVEYHSTIINLSAHFEKIFSVVMLVEHVGVLLVLCCLMYDGSLFPASDPRFIRDLFLASCIMSQACTTGYYGHELILQSELIGGACYGPDFVSTDIRLQKGCAMIIQRCQRPITFTAGKFIPLAVPTSFALIKAAFSYFMVLRSMNTQ